MPLILSPTPVHVHHAAAILRSGGVVAFATETVYGLGADTFSSMALANVYELKGRPANNPLIAHVLDAQHAGLLTDDWNDRAAALAGAFWPGPLTLVLPRRTEVPD